jgi:hypothetical protein
MIEEWLRLQRIAREARLTFGLGFQRLMCDYVREMTSLGLRAHDEEGNLIDY